ncbi:hypothetical protein CC78DRAFT_410437, partial [Lojkania enalia]
GIARLELDDLDFGFALRQKEHREKSKRAQAHLLDVFALGGCRREEEENFIDAIVETSVFESAVESAGLCKETFKAITSEAKLRPSELPKLRISRPVDCLNGLHRVAAAKNFLDRNDRWWIVRLYSKGTETFHRTVKLKLLIGDTATRLVESFAHEQRYSDGTIFRNIRRYHLLNDAESENRWWAHLTNTKRKDLRQLMKNNLIIAAFDRLLDFPGLWTPIQLGTLHRLHGLRCPEELNTYLQHIEAIWSCMVPSNSRRYVDTVTVQHLESCAPGVSENDERRVTFLMESNQIFATLPDEPGIKNEILQSIKSVRCLIPSLRTFFENQKYLEPCCIILRTLLGESEKRSIWKGFSANYFRPPELYVQYSEQSTRTFSLSESSVISFHAGKAIGYLQLWLFCLRHFPEMTSIAPKMTPGMKKQRRDHNPALWQKLGRLAVALGFRTPPALQLAAQSPDRENAMQFLQSARPSW